MTVYQLSHSEATPPSSPFPRWTLTTTHRSLAGRLGYILVRPTLDPPCPPRRNLYRVLKGRSTGGQAETSCLVWFDTDMKVEERVRRAGGRSRCWREMDSDMAALS